MRQRRTNTTEAIARHIGTETKGTLYEIVPEVPYTEDDLKYYTDCRADREQADPSARPAINGSVENMEKYDVVFLGYPIWHGQAPRIISTFLESYDFADKTIVPFCTSASSGIGSSDTNLHSLAPDAHWIAGGRFSSGTSQNTVADWIDSLGIAKSPAQEVITNMYVTINGNKLEVTLGMSESQKAGRDSLGEFAPKFAELNDDAKFGGIFGLGEPNTAYAKYFTGNSYLNPLTDPQKTVFMANVTFEPKCRNNWHIHKAEKGGGQILLCTDGCGWYQEWGKPAQALKAGDVVTIPANVKQWHGAAANGWFSHIAVECAGVNASNEWLEPVSDEEYNALK